MIVGFAIGATIGVVTIAAAPIQHPSDRMFFLVVYSLGLGVLGHNWGQSPIFLDGAG